MKTMNGLLLVLSLVLQMTSYAHAEVNLDDKLDSYSLKLGNQVVGKVTVQSTFVEEPVATPIRITVLVKCFKGFRLKNFEKTQTWEAYDYGRSSNRAELSSFDNAKQILSVYYFSSKIGDDGGVQAVEEKPRTFKVSGVCVAQK